eukprot:2611211-Heterocapsa_arctica.AAC.1
MKAATGTKARRDLRGLEGTVDWTVPRKMLRKLDISSPNDAGILRNVLAGGTWPQVRVAEVDKQASKICPCCQVGEEDEYHRCYLCGTHNMCRVHYEHIRTQTQRELNHAVRPEEVITPQREHLWCRGLPQMVDVGKLLVYDSSPTTMVCGAVKAYTDGGASYPADPRLRRSGWGIWVEKGHPLNSYGVVPGIEQTAGRAELYAA